VVATLHIAIANRPMDKSITCLLLEAPSLVSGDEHWAYALKYAHRARSDVPQYKAVTSPSATQQVAHHGVSPFQGMNYTAQNHISNKSLREPPDNIWLPRTSVSSNAEISHSNMGQLCSSLPDYFTMTFHRVIFLCVVLLIAAVFQKGPRLASDRLRDTVNMTSKDVVGVGVQVRTVEMQVCRGRVFAKDVVVGNPDGFHAEHLVRFDTVCMKLRMCTLLWSWGRDIHVSHLAVSGVHVIYEKAFTTSNVEESLAVVNKSSDSPTCVEQGKGRRKPLSVTLHEVKIERVQVTVAAHVLMGTGFALPVGDLRWLNFSREMGEMQPTELVLLLLERVLQAVVSKIGG